jgi:hypothetical protein
MVLVAHGTIRYYRLLVENIFDRADGRFVPARIRTCSAPEYIRPYKQNDDDIYEKCLPMFRSRNRCVVAVAFCCLC